MSKTKICKVCGQAYSYCPTCAEDRRKPTYMVSFDKEICKEIFDALSANGVGKASDSDTLQKLQELNYENAVIKNQGILNHIERLKNSGKTEAKPQKKNKEHKVKEKEEVRENLEQVSSKMEEPVKEEKKGDSMKMPEIFMSM